MGMPLKEYLELMTDPTHMIYIFDKSDRLIRKKQQAYLKKDKLLDTGCTVGRADFRLEFHKYLPGDRRGSFMNVTEQNAGVYSLSDITICKYIEIHLEQEIPAA